MYAWQRKDRPGFLRAGLSLIKDRNYLIVTLNAYAVFFYLFSIFFASILKATVLVPTYAPRPFMVTFAVPFFTLF